MNTEFPYSRLGSRMPHIFGYDTLWMGSDHLLSVHNTRFVEEYRRFEWREIQAILIRKQPRFRMPVYWALACGMAFVGGITGTVRHNGSVTVLSWAVLLLLALYWLSASLLLSCRCHVQTAIGAYELRGLYRYAAALRAVETLEARIHEAQGTLPEDWDVDDALDPAPPQAGEQIPEADSGNRKQDLVAALACAALLVDALFSWLARAPHISRAVQSFNVLATLVAVILPVFSIAVSMRSKRFTFMRNLFLIAVLAVGLANYGTRFATVLVAFPRIRPQPSLSVSPFNESFYWLNQIAEVSLGLTGLLYLLATARRRQTSAP
jgi:hypothetical protein